MSESSIIKTIVTHARPHEDELAGIALLMELPSRFDTSKAGIEIVTSDQGLEKYKSRDDVLFIGVGARSGFSAGCADRIFDEHGDKDKTVCSADLVARKVVQVNGEFKEFLDEVRLHDLGRSSAPTSLASVLKARYEQEDEHRVIEWGLRGLRAICRRIRDARPITPNPDAFLEEAASAYEQVGRANRVDPRIFQGLLASFTGSANSGKMTEIGTMFYALMDESAPEARYWCRLATLDLARRQVAFKKGVEDFKRNHTRLEVTTPFFVAKVAFMQSDSGLMDKVFRCRDAGAYDILVLRNAKGQVGIFTKNNPGQLAPLNLEPLVRMVRWAEIMASGKKPHSFWGLATEEGPKGEDTWYYFKQGGMILNGSKSKPEVRATRLTNKDLAYILKCAFTERGLQRFMRENGVLDSRIA